MFHVIMGLNFDVLKEMQKRLKSIAQTLELGLFSINTLRPRQNGRHFADDIFKSIFLNENV